MRSFYCMDCGKEFKVEILDQFGNEIKTSKIKCDRCGSKNFVSISKINRNFKCLTCGHCFHVSMQTAKRIFRYKEKMYCNKCGKSLITKILKKEYLRYAGLLQKKQCSVQKKLFES